MSATSLGPKASALRRGGQVALARLGERLARRPAFDATDVPASPHEITVEWLTAVLCAGTPGACVTSATPIGASSGTTDRQALKLTYNRIGAEAPRTVSASMR